MTITATNPKNKQEPVWFRIGRRRPVTDLFKNTHSSACIHRSHIFYSEDLSDQALAKSLCATCPTFKACALWALLSPDCDTEFAIVAGMDPDWRRRIREGREHFWDWRRDFNYAQRAARAASRKREHAGVHKREQRLREIPPCPDCGSNEYVNRDGRDKLLNRQRYQCTVCEPSYFLGGTL
jgi:hypothetical protein